MKTKTTLMSAHYQWSSRPRDERFETLADLKAAVTARQEKSEAIKFDLQKMAFEVEDQKLLVNTGDNQLRLTNWSYQQMLGFVGLQNDMSERARPETIASVMNDYAKTSKRLYGSTVLAYNQKIARGFLGNQYQLLWDSQVLEWLEDLTAKGNWKRPKALDEATRGPAGLYAGDRNMFVFLVDGGKTFEDDSAEGVGRGIFVWNSEVYGKPFGFQSFLFRYVCGNHMVWDASEVSGFTMRHFGKGFQAETRERLYKFTEDYMNSGAAEQKAINAARKKVLAGNNEELTDTLKGFGIGRKFATTVIEYLEEREQAPTVWNVANAITWNSQKFENADVRNVYDTSAGKLLVAATK